jgi:aminopeptidase N
MEPEDESAAQGNRTQARQSALASAELMTKEQVLGRVNQLLARPLQDDAALEHAFNGILSLMTAVYGEASAQVRGLVQRRADIAKNFKFGAWTQATFALVHGSLTNLKEEVEAGVLSSLERRIASDVLSDLIQLAREALKETADGAKNVAAVLAAAAFEDTIRRIAREHAGVIGQDKLEVVIGRLKEAGLLVPPQLGIALSYLSFRNHALHAEWDKIDRAAVSSVLGFVEQLLLKHFG